MGFIWSSKKSKSEPETYRSNIGSFISSIPSYSVSEDRAMQLPAFKSCVDIIVDSISALPIYLYKEELNGDVKPQSNDNRVRLLNEDSNRYDTAIKIKRLMVKDLLLYGRAYLVRDKEGIHHLEFTKMQVQLLTSTGYSPAKKEYKYQGSFGEVKIDEENIIEISTGKDGVLVHGNELLQSAINEQEFQSALLKNGAVPIGVIKAASRLTDKAIDRLRGSFEALYGGPKKAGKTVIFEEGLEYQQISLRPDELQLHETSKQTVASIARLFNVPESMINSSANKYASLEQNNIHFLQYTIAPLIKLIEESLDKQLLFPYEKQEGYYFRFDTKEFLRTTEKEKIETTISMFEKDLITKNEARARLELEKIDRDYYKLPMGVAIKYVDSDNFINLNSAQVINEKGGTNEDETGTKSE